MNAKLGVAVVILLFGAFASHAETFWKAGVARANITPTEPVWMAGYAARTNGVEGKVMDLWIKVLALRDGRGNRSVVLTSDLLGIPRSIYDNVTGQLKEQFGLEPHQVMLTASHTHCGPALRNSLSDAYPLDEEKRAAIEKFSRELEIRIVETVGAALANVEPVRLMAAEGKTGFAVNRRNNPEGKVPRLIFDGALQGPVDHSVPVLAVYHLDETLKAVLFGYACHNTVMSFNKWCGDYAGFAQIALEKSHPTATAMFFMGCGGDQNPLPRRKLEQAERYGSMLAAAVEESLLNAPRVLKPTLRTSMEMVTLNFGPALTREELVELQKHENPTYRRYSTRLLGEMDAGKTIPRSYPYPVQAWTLGEQLLISLGGEVVVDYALRFKKEHGPQTWVAAYCNDVMTYIPSARVLKEGGYEGGLANRAYGIPANRWADDVEDVIATTVRRQVDQVQKAEK